MVWKSYQENHGWGQVQKLNGFRRPLVLTSLRGLGRDSEWSGCFWNWPSAQCASRQKSPDLLFFLSFVLFFFWRKFCCLLWGLKQGSELEEVSFLRGGCLICQVPCLPHGDEPALLVGCVGIWLKWEPWHSEPPPSGPFGSGCIPGHRNACLGFCRAGKLIKWPFWAVRPEGRLQQNLLVIGSWFVMPFCTCASAFSLYLE